MLPHHLAGRSIQEATMAIATAPLTEAEALATIAAHVEQFGLDISSNDDAYHPFDAFVDKGSSPWRDLRPSESARLEAIITEAEARAWARAHAAIVEEAVAAALAFAAEYPDAPRAGAAA
jgi:hypothetical protein